MRPVRGVTEAMPLRLGRRSSRVMMLAEPLERRVLLSHSITPVPFQNQPAGAPGTVEFENYDSGGEGVSFHNPNPVAQPGGYRNDGLDIEPVSDAGGGYALESTVPGEWLNYTVNAASTTVYSLGLRVASGDSGGTVHVEDLTGRTRRAPSRSPTPAAGSETGPRSPFPTSRFQWVSMC